MGQRANCVRRAPAKLGAKALPKTARPSPLTKWMSQHSITQSRVRQSSKHGYLHGAHDLPAIYPKNCKAEDAITFGVNQRL